MLRLAAVVGALIVVPAIASAQQPCTPDAYRVVDQIYRHMLERAPDPGSKVWVDRLTTADLTVRETVRSIAKSQEHLRRWGNESREQVVRTMYRHILDREPNGDTFQRSVELFTRRGATAVVDQLVNSPEYQQAYGEWGVPGANGLNLCPPGARNNLSQNVPGGNGMRFRRLDANGDGQISRDEWRGSARSFQNFDWNSDGVLAGEELSVDAERRAVARNPDEDVPFNERFDYLDVNGNGVIERNEWDGGANAFRRLDTSGDQRLSRGEFNNVNRSHTFASLDMNRDGRIGLNEWPWTHRSFDQQDDNGDGVLTQGEFRGGDTSRR